MRKLSVLVGMMLALAFVTGLATAAPAPDTVDDATAVDSWGDEEKKARKDHSYRPGSRDKASKPSKDKDKDKDKYKPWKEVTKDAEKHEGLFDLYTKREDVMFVIKENQLDKPYVVFMSLSKGIGARFVIGGLPIAPSIMFDFHRVEDHVQMRMLNTRFRATDDEALENSIDLSFGNSILFNLKIASEKDSLLLVKMNPVFVSDIGDMAFWLQIVLKKPVQMDKKKGYFKRVKTFPENVEIEVMLTYSPGDRRGLHLPQVPDSRYITLGVHYSIHKLPEEPMKPRYMDDRVGYFGTPHKDFSRDSNDNFFVHYINRWRLEKEDPSAELSKPKEPIVFYIDPTIPKKYRKWVREGIELWQKAFEAAGFREAIVAGDPDDVEDFDAEDARYHTIRWIVSDEPSFGAIGPSRVDPRTGEIIDADILMEQNMIASFRRAYRRYAGPEAFFQNDPMLNWQKSPEDNKEWYDLQQLLMNRFGTCGIGHGFSANFQFMSLAVLMDGGTEGHTGMKVPDEYVGEAIRFVTAHEVGHTIGLRHNFKSSISTPYEKLNDRYTISEIGLTGSVMDYPSPNISRDRGDQGYYYTPSVGTYDQWAVTYGYTEFRGDKSAEGERKELLEIASEANLKKHAYGTDEDTYPAGAMDPNSNIWDLGDKPLKWAEDRIGVCQDILSDHDLTARVVSEGDNYVSLRAAVETILIQEYLALTKTVKYVGGSYTARPHKGDNSDQKPIMSVPAVESREAVDFLTQHAFS
ncbi:MAG: zinc-dependent metalloprotease, partial [bacterium]|nr:zinc-dependent metalloprotease [bacterium]